MEQRVVEGRNEPPWMSLLAIVVLSVLLGLLRAHELAGDPEIYRTRMVLLFEGRVPYLDFFFEHLPLAVLPMVLAWSLGGAFGVFVFSALFAALMATCLGVILRITVKIGGALAVAGAGSRWLAVAAPLFPIVLFRYDPFSVLLTVAALWAFIDGRDRTGFWLAFAGTLTKGWSVVLALTEWWRGRRLRAFGLLAWAVVTLALILRLPGFTSGRAFTGIHSETLFGGLFTLARLNSGESLELLPEAGATYIGVPAWATTLNLLLGVVILGVALRRSSGEFAWTKGIRLLGAATLAILIGSPLLSPQFLLWPTPFLALHRDRIVRFLAGVTSALTLVYMMGWNPGFEGELWWVGVLNLRNLFLLGLGAVAAWAVGEPGRRPITVA